MGKAFNRVDGLVGQSVRAYRMAAGMSQEELGRRLEVTFQQIQKYEKGVNRIGSGRLYQISTIFNVPIAAFFEGADSTRTGGASKQAGLPSSPLQLISEPQAFRLLQAFSQLEHMGLRRTVINLVEQMVEATPPSR